MKISFLLLVPILFFACGQNSLTTGSANLPLASSGAFDPQLALESGADEYGMRKFVIAYLKRGPNRDRDSTESAALQQAHMANITRMAEEGTLVLAGPFLDDGDIRGIYVFAVETLEEAEELTKTDPAIQAGSLVMELHPWYASAALMQLSELHKRVAEKDF